MHEFEINKVDISGNIKLNYKLVKTIMQINAYFKNKHYLLSDPNPDSDLSYSDPNLDLDSIRFSDRIRIFKNIRPIRSVRNTRYHCLTKISYLRQFLKLI